VTPADYVQAVRREAAALAAAAERNLDASVPSCPDWNVRDLVVHTGGVHRFWCEIAERRLQNPREANPLPAPGDDELMNWFEEGAARLVKTLERSDPSTAVWTWAAQRNVGFIQRRMAHETAVHRWDAEAASGAVHAIEPSLAADGVDEMLFVFVSAQEPDFGGERGSIHLHRTDGEGEWIVYLTPEGVKVDRGHHKGDAAVRASASDLDLLLWRRVLPTDLEVFGDRAVLERFLAWLDLS
jgi:uncharacterized protein (TIGR03083 family)